MNLFKKPLNTKTLLKALLTLGFFLLVSNLAIAQDQQLSDSLEVLYKSGDYEDAQKLEILKLLSEEETNADKQLNFSLQLLVEAKSQGAPTYEMYGYLQQGNAYQSKGDLTKALENYLEAIGVAHENNYEAKEGAINISIADAYSIMGDSETAVDYYKKGIEILERVGDSIDLASGQLNLGDEYYNQQKLDSALIMFNASGKIFKALEYELGEAYNLGNVGLVQAELGETELAQENLYKAIDIMTEYGDYQPICVYLNAMSDIYESKRNYRKSLQYGKRSLELAMQFGLKDEIGEAHLRLSNIYETRGDLRSSFKHYKDHITYRDSVVSVKGSQKMANERTEYEVGQKQLELDLVNQQKKTQRIIVIAIAIALLLSALLAVSLFKRNKLMKRANAIIASEKERSDNLLKNILPEETAEELKEHGEVEAKSYDEVTVLFTDFKGFTSQSEKLSPADLVKSINYYFSKFDAIVEKYELEKIKTIGDAYMCAGGLPDPLEDHAAKVCQAALEMAEFVKTTKRSIKHDLAKFDIRIGLNTGPVVAGVVGTKKFQYDIWGDAVNTAARMESSSDIGRVNISESTYQQLQNYDVFEFEHRGALEAKGKGKINMYFVNYVV